MASEGFGDQPISPATKKPSPPAAVTGPGNRGGEGWSKYSKSLPGLQKEMAGALGFCGVVLRRRVTVKIAFCKCRLQILNNFLIGHGAKAANGGKKADFFNCLFRMVFVLHLCL